MEYSVKLGYTETLYTGKTLTPSITVKDEYGNTLKKGTDYTVTYSNNKNVGVGKTVVTFKGLPYKLTKTVRFKIYPKAPATCKSALTGYDDVKVTWSKSVQASGVSGWITANMAPSINRDAAASCSFFRSFPS